MSGADTRGPKPADDIDFTTFVISLGRNVAIQLDRQSPHFDLALAKQTIDILGMIEEKTRGNLTETEASLLADILYQTRVEYKRVQTQGA